jgi:hypothetical protein
MRHITTTPHIDSLINAGSPVAIGVSGGKDSDVAAVRQRYAELMIEAGHELVEYAGVRAPQQLSFAL